MEVVLVLVYLYGEHERVVNASIRVVENDSVNDREQAPVQRLRERVLGERHVSAFVLDRALEIAIENVCVDELCVSITTANTVSDIMRKDLII